MLDKVLDYYWVIGEDVVSALILILLLSSLGLAVGVFENPRSRPMECTELIVEEYATPFNKTVIDVKHYDNMRDNAPVLWPEQKYNTTYICDGEPRP